MAERELLYNCGKCGKPVYSDDRINTGYCKECDK